MLCPICEAENPEGAPECELCGKALAHVEAPAPVPDPMPGLEPTELGSSAGPAGASLLAELEQTKLVAPGLRVQVQPLEVQRSEIEETPGAPSFWGGPAVDLDTGRAEDDGARTAAPARDAACPFCGAEGDGAVCDSCGRRKSRFSAPAAQGQGEGDFARGDTVLCPACFSRVEPGPRCVECSVPFPPALGGA